MLVHPLPPETQPLEVFRRFRRRRGCVFFDSSLRRPGLGRYSFVAADPFEWITCNASEDGFALVAKQLEEYTAETLPDQPPFQGGAAGLFAYDLCHAQERLPKPRHNEFPAPAMAVGLYDFVVAFDHEKQQAVVISQGFPETAPERRERRAQQRLEQVLAILQSEPHDPTDEVSCAENMELARQHSVPGFPGVTSDFSREQYIAAVARAVDYIHAGDIFQVNLSQRLLARLAEPVWRFYVRLREQSPAPFSAYFDAGAVRLCSASPERFLQVQERRVETRPIKGTRPRAGDPREDAGWAEQLSASEKDRAENTMIVDLLRNDLSRVCVDDSVAVPTLCGLESYEQVHHLVSVVRGQLRPEMTAVDLLKAAFPGGSVTGAPKVRAMEVIAELEPTVRGPYCGSLGYVGFNGAMDSSILIRTAIASRGWLQMPVGGGVVADSDPVAEYEETLHKAAGMLAALEPSR